MKPTVQPQSGKVLLTAAVNGTTYLALAGLLAALMLSSATAAQGQPLEEYKGTVKGALVGRIEIFQVDDAIKVAFAENRSDGYAVLTRGAKVFRLAGKWSTCQHGELASYCQLAGSPAVYRFDETAMSREQRGQPTYVLAATASGYAARVRASTGDILIHHAGATETTLANGTVTEAWSNGKYVAYKPDALTLRIISLTNFESRDVKTSGLIVGNSEQNDSSSAADSYDCHETATYCGESGLEEGCFITEYSCTCKTGAAYCPYGQTYQYRTVYCPDPRADEPTCGGDPYCLPSAISIGDGVTSQAAVCGGRILGFRCDGPADGGNCDSLATTNMQSLAAPDIQVTTSPVTVAGKILPAGARVVVYVQSSGGIYVAVP